MFKKSLSVLLLAGVFAVTAPACKKKEAPEENINSEGAVRPAQAPLPPKIQGSVVPAAPIVPPPPPSLNAPTNLPGSMPSSLAPSTFAPPPPPPPPPPPVPAPAMAVPPPPPPPPATAP